MKIDEAYEIVLLDLPCEIHELFMIEVGHEGDLYWVIGLFWPEINPGIRYEEAFIKSCSTHEEAMKLGGFIAQKASMNRLIRGLAGACQLKEVWP